MNFTLEFDREEAGRCIAEVLELPGVLMYGENWLEAKTKAETSAWKVLEERANLEQP
jgi:hypothetical protein